MGHVICILNKKCVQHNPWHKLHLLCKSLAAEGVGWRLEGQQNGVGVLWSGGEWEQEGMFHFFFLVSSEILMALLLRGCASPRWIPQRNGDRGIPKLGETLTGVSINKALIRKKEQGLLEARGGNTNGDIILPHSRRSHPQLPRPLGVWSPRP